MPRLQLASDRPFVLDCTPARKTRRRKQSLTEAISMKSENPAINGTEITVPGRPVSTTQIPEQQRPILRASDRRNRANGHSLPAAGNAHRTAWIQHRDGCRERPRSLAAAGQPLHATLRADVANLRLEVLAGASHLLAMLGASQEAARLAGANGWGPTPPEQQNLNCLQRK